jgi:hypothetical protein
MIEGWRELRIEELHNWYSAPKIIRMIKSWNEADTAHMECMYRLCGKAGRKEITRNTMT